jgi:hypothetical protein
MSETRSPDLILYTDGSGRELDGYSGYAALVRTANGSARRFVMGCMSESTTDRAEFMALLEGLRMCTELWKRNLGTELEAPGAERPRPLICWYSDRESLVMSVRKVYARDNCPDLWAAFQYYEDLFEIESHNVTEPFTETDPSFVDVDLQSSTMREVLKQYCLNSPLSIDVQPKVGRAVKASAPNT